jgi:hypothetical protein
VASQIHIAELKKKREEDKNIGVDSLIVVNIKEKEIKELKRQLAASVASTPTTMPAAHQGFEPLTSTNSSHPSQGVKNPSLEKTALIIATIPITLSQKRHSFPQLGGNTTGSRFSNNCFNLLNEPESFFDQWNDEPDIMPMSKTLDVVTTAGKVRFELQTSTQTLKGNPWEHPPFQPASESNSDNQIQPIVAIENVAQIRKLKSGLRK